MLGTILGGLTNAAAAEDLLSAIGDQALLNRVKSAAEENAVSPGTYVAAAVRHLLDHGDEEIWLDLVGKMADSPQPGAAALQVVLSRAFPVVNAHAERGDGHDSHAHPLAPAGELARDTRHLERDEPGRVYSL
ncbi:MAG: hypothetical protein P4L76_04900 [Beijerinckiaceae bacterium]|nr:hypothetical protein [Beijerinckiaceae bacterium]